MNYANRFYPSLKPGRLVAILANGKAVTLKWIRKFRHENEHNLGTVCGEKEMPNRRLYYCAHSTLSENLLQ